MNPLAHLDAAVAPFVHDDVRADVVDAHAHRTFLLTRVGLSLTALALAPLCLVAGAAPAAWEAGALAWLALPFCAALAVSRTGNLRVGEALSLAAWVGLGATVALGTGSSLGLAILLMVPVEAASASTGRFVVPSVLASSAVVLLAALRARFGLPAAPLHLTPLGAAALMAALAYGGLLASVAGRAARRRDGEARADRDRYRALADAIDDVVLQLDRAGAACRVGCASLRLFGLAPTDLAGRGLFERLHVADRPVFLKLVADAADGRSGTATLRLRTGRTVPSQRGDFDEPVFAAVDLSLRPPNPGEAVTDAARPVAAVGLMRDVSARVEQDRLVALAQTSADRTHAGRDMFLANVSHELRTPLNAIIGFSEILSNPALEPADADKRRDYAGIIHQSGLHLLAVVNGILDASKIESGSFDIHPEAFDLHDLVAVCCDMVGLKAEQSGVRLQREVAPGADELVGDKRACKQIVLNLLSNALKFTPAGGRVAITARPDGNSVLITVSDTGVGIAARDLPRLGDPFFQARAAYDRPSDGTGLGLSVVRGLVGLHGGSIAIESAPGQGTRVSVRLPQDCRRAAVAPGGVTKIETISRYSSGVRHDGVPNGGRMHKIA
ncbi:PAS domain-containing sensor histidine kinase [Lichenibacterium minor]|uniref:histidine kinase n=1 Tax=Lichenibacterium minor TaxID=2316528 RepID=A0A4Q2UDP2_9HYPH|nr:PAS domain-containing sensor histidine kinase [Lichenibacterium minor]RYC32945.1 PAS domain-containing sensor histidine kinase [Lichenibacterium minor]